MADVGDIRVSSIPQNDSRQLEGLSMEKIFIEKASEKPARA